MSISVSRSAGVGSTTMLNRRFRAADMSFTPRSRVLAVAMMEKPRCAGTSVASSGTEIRFSESSEIIASCTSEAQRVISSKRARLPDSIARKIGLLISDSWLGPRAMSMA